MASTSSDAMEKFMQNLKVIRTINNALEFCSLLIKAEGMQEEYRQPDKRLHRSLHCLPLEEEIFCEIKTIFNRETADGLVKIFLKALNAPEEMPCQGNKEVLNITSKGECDNKPAEYLNELIAAVKSFVEYFCSPGIYNWHLGLRKEIFEKKLVSLKKFLLSYGRHKTELAFSQLFWLCIAKYDFSGEEKKEIGDIMAMPFFETLVKRLCFDYDFLSAAARLQHRSTLQFIKELFADYSDEREVFKGFMVKLNAIIETKDNEAIWRYCAQLPDSKDDSSCLSDKDISVEFQDELEELNDAGACDVPKEHTWWQLYKKLYFLSW